MRSEQRSVRAHRQHPQCPTRQVAARHRSADLPGQADGSHKPHAAYAAPTPRKRASVSEPIRVLRVLRDLRLLTAPAAPPAQQSASHTAPPSEHTHLESPCQRAAAPRKPPFHHPQHHHRQLPFACGVGLPIKYVIFDVV